MVFDYMDHDLTGLMERVRRKKKKSFFFIFFLSPSVEQKRRSLSSH